MIPPFHPHQPIDDKITMRDLVTSQQNVKLVLDEISNTRRLQLSSEVIRASGADVAIALTTAVENLVEHGLGRAVAGWRLIDLQGPAIVWRVTSPATTGYDSTKHLALACSANVTIKLEVW